MKINFSQQLYTIEGEAVVLEEETVLTLKYVCTQALLTAPKEEITGEESFLRYQLAQRINSDTQPVLISIEEVAKIRSLLSKTWAPLIAGQAWEMLDNQEE